LAEHPGIRQKPPLLVVAARYPFPLDKGDRLRLYHQVLSLSDFFEVTVVGFGEEGAVSTIFIERGIRSKLISTNRIGQLLGILSSLWRGLPLQVGLFSDAAMRHFIHSYAKEHPNAYLYVQTFRVVENLPKDLLWKYKVIDYMDAFGYGMEQRAHQVTNPLLSFIYRMEAKRVRSYELVIADRFDQRTIISQQDAERIPDLDLVVVTNGIDLSFFGEAPPDTSATFDGVFVGNLGYLPNIVAAEYLVHEILAEANKMGWVPKVLLAGARPDIRVEALVSAQVTLQAWVSDIRTSYSSGRVFVAPIFGGTGQQNKILEAMAMGKPIVSTPEVFSAFDGDLPHRDLMEARDPKEFIQKWKTFHENPLLSKEIGQDLQAYVARKFPWHVANSKLCSIFTANNK